MTLGWALGTRGRDRYLALGLADQAGKRVGNTPVPDGIFFGTGLDMLQSKPRRWKTGINRALAAEAGADYVGASVLVNKAADSTVAELAVRWLVRFEELVGR